MKNAFETETRVNQTLLLKHYIDKNYVNENSGDEVIKKQEMREDAGKF